jgi:hypothetical protein
MQLHIGETVQQEMGAAGVLILGRGMMERSFEKWQAVVPKPRSIGVGMGAGQEPGM